MRALPSYPIFLDTTTSPRSAFVTESLLHPVDRQQVPLRSIQTHGRSRSTPAQIYIHPQHSNHARADAVARDLGFFGDTELVRASDHSETQGTWGRDKGKEFARFLLGGRESLSHEGQLFRIDDDNNPDGFESDSS